MNIDPVDETSATDSPAPAVFRPVSRRVATFWNIVFSYVYMGLVIVRNLVLVPFYLHHLTPAEYGAWVATGQVLAYLVTDFGLLAVLFQQVAVAYGQSDRAQLERLGGTGLVISAALALICTAMCLVLSPFIPHFFRTLKPQEVLHLTHTLMIVSGANGGYILALAAVGLMRSLQRPFLSGLVRVLAEVVGIIVTILLLVRGWGLESLAWGLALRTVLGAGVNLSWLLWVWLHEFQIGLRWAASDAWNLGRLSVYQCLTYLAGGLKDTIDPFLIGVILTPEIALMYTLTIRSAEMIRLQLVGPLSAAMIPSLSHLHGEGRRVHFNRVVILMSQLQTLIASIGLGGVLIFNKTFVTLWVGADQYSGMTVTVLIVIYGLLYLTTLLAYEAVYSLGQFWNLAKAVWLDLLIRAPLAVVLIYYFGPWGALAGAIAGQAISYNGYLVVVAVRKLGFTRAELLEMLRDGLKLTIGPLALAGLFWFVGSLDPAKMDALKHSGHKLAAWLQFILHGGIYLAAEVGLAYILAPQLVRMIRSRGRMEPAP